MSTPPADSAVDAAALANDLARIGVVPPDRLTGLLADFPGGGPAALAEFLVARGVLTPFQAARAAAGETKSLALGPYRLVGPYRQGTLGPVFRAEKAGKPFAVRALPLRSLWQARQAKQLARTLATLPPHPVLVPLADADSASGFHYLVWPLAEGELLGELVPVAGPLLPAEAAALLTHLAAALGACHARQVAHGLLTPHAVLFGPDNAPKLLDLGAGALLTANLAAGESLFDTLSSAVAVAGVLPFAAPEWVADPTKLTLAADQYALGAVGYFALTGQAPDPGAPRPLAEANPDVPADLAAAIDRLLRPDPADRFTGMDEAQEVLAELAGQPVSTDDESAPSAPSVSRSSADRTGAGLPAGVPGWAAPNAGAPRPAGRDESEASVGFDLPDLVSAAEIAPPAAARRPGPVNPSALTDTVAPPADTPPLPARTTTPRPAPTTPDTPPPQKTPRPARLAPLADDRGGLLPPILPATPLLPTAPADRPMTGSNPSLPTTRAETPPVLPSAVEEPAPPDSALWKKVRKKITRFWQTPTDVIQVGVFGPPAVTHSQTPRLTVFLYPPSAGESVGTLARAFQHDAVLLGASTLAVEVARGDRLAVHLAVAGVAVTNPLASCVWRGNPHRVPFDLVVTWETPAGPAKGVVSVGKDDARIGKVEFTLPVLDGTG